MGNRGRVRAAVRGNGVCAIRVLMAGALASGSAAAIAADADTAQTYDQTIAVTEAPADVAGPQRASDAVELEEIVVFGEKVGRTLAQTTSSVSVTTGQNVADYGDDSVSDVVRRTANASVTNEGDISLRGVNAGGAEGFSAGQPVISTYVDGVAIDSVGQQGNVLDLFDVEQVEILRGAQSTSQGRNALAGAVVVNTRDPTEYWDMNARLRLAELNGREYAFAGGGPIGGGLAFRVVADYQSDDGFIRNVTRDDPDWNKREDLLLRGKLAWRPSFSPDSEALLTVGRAHRDGPTRPVVRLAETEDDDKRVAYDGVDHDSTSRSVPLSLRLRHSFSEHVELSSTTGYIKSVNYEFADYDGHAEDNGVYQYDQRGKTLTEELRLNLRGWHGFTGVAGLYAGRYQQSFLNQARDLRVQLSEVAPVPVVGDLLAARVDFINESTTDADNIAAFTEFDYAITDRLTLVGGLRYDRESSDIYSNYQITRADAYPTLPGGAGSSVLDQIQIPALPVFTAAGVVPGTGTGRSISASYDALLPKIGVRYALTADTNAFLTYTEAYRAGGGDIDVQDGTIHEFDPEYTKTLETGLRSAWFGRRLQTRANVYYTRWLDQQVQVPNQNGTSTYTQNAADSRLYGIEFENSLRIGAASSVYVNGGYAHTEFDNYVTGSNDYSGNRFAQAPEWTAGVGGVARGLGGWFASSSFTYTGTNYTTPSNSKRERGDASRLLDARIGYEAGTVSIYAFGRNLLDQEYAVYRYGYAGGTGVEPGRTIGYGAPRVFGVQFDVSFQ